MLPKALYCRQNRILSALYFLSLFIDVLCTFAVVFALIIFWKVETKASLMDLHGMSSDFRLAVVTMETFTDMGKLVVPSLLRFNKQL